MKRKSRFFRTATCLACFFVGLMGSVVAQATFDLASATGTGNGWSWQDSVLLVNDGANITITGTVNDGRRIVVDTNATVSITLQNVSITGLAIVHSPLLLNDGATVTLTIEGENMLTAGDWGAGVQAPEGTTLIINGIEGSLSANGGDYGAGIGGTYIHSAGNITINSGIVTATGGIGGAGIGGGDAEIGGVVLPFIYLKNYEGRITEIPFVDGTISISETKILIDIPKYHFEFDYDDIEKLYFKNKKSL